jgi:riboflavin kinase/FMN adenylyltransferase
MPPISIALGYFDGVHKGHQKVVGKAIHQAKELHVKSAVMTFDPHPSVVLGHKHQHIKHITPLEVKADQFEKMGLDYLFIVRFTSGFASLEPQEFVDQYLIGLNAVHVVAGFDYTYGKLGRGTMETLPFHSRGQFEQTTVHKLVDSTEKVSSSRIRQFIQSGDVAKANELLGRAYSMKGTVVHGEKRGRKIGFPTANIEQSYEYLMPAVGVYAVRIFVQHRWLDGVCNLGYKPTFKDPNEKAINIEVHIFDFNLSIYGEEVVITWHEWIRNEQKFSGIDELVQQIQKDKETAIEYFKKIEG